MTTPTQMPESLKVPEELAAIQHALDAGPTPGPWIIATSNSWRRIVTEHRMESVCEPVTQNDGHPDLYFRNGGASGPDARLIEACNPAAMTAVLSHISALQSALKDRDAEIERLKKDAERLDALESVAVENQWIVAKNADSFTASLGRPRHATRRTLREAIDAAIDSMKGGA